MKKVHFKFIYSEKATKFCEISNFPLVLCSASKSKVEILQKFAAFSEYMNFTDLDLAKKFQINIFYMCPCCFLVFMLKRRGEAKAMLEPQSKHSLSEAT